MFKFKSLVVLFTLVTLFALAEKEPVFGQESPSSSADVSSVKTKDKNIAGQPYSAHVELIHSGLGGECKSAPVPEGMRLVIETVVVAINSLEVPEAYITFFTNFGFRANFDRLLIPLRLRGSSSYSGNLQTHMISGPITVVTPTGSAVDGVVSISLRGTHDLRGYFFGHLLPL